MWLGGGVESGEAVKTLADAGVTVISSTWPRHSGGRPSRQPARVAVPRLKR
ncbi:hypothetical protein MJ579_23995 [Klebsiella pneumoniae]|nr:hypothetical protein MJ579_23995 [Klebsiella pneumoniae]